MVGIVDLAQEDTNAVGRRGELVIGLLELGDDLLGLLELLLVRLQLVAEQEQVVQPRIVPRGHADDLVQETHGP